MKKINLKTIILITLIGLLPWQLSQAQANRPSIQITSNPNQNSNLSDGVNIKFRLKNTSDLKRGFALLVAKDTITRKQFILGRVKLDSESKTYTFDWKPEENLFTNRNVDFENGLFKFAVKARINGKWARGYSKRFKLKRKQPKPQTTMSELKITNTLQTPDPSPQTPVKLITDDMLLVSSYQFSALLEPFIVSKLTIVNDTDDDGFDQDASENTRAIEQVVVRYKNEAGETLEEAGNFDGAKATLSDMDFYVPRDQSSDIEIWVKGIANSKVNKDISGEVFQLGIQDTNNDESSFRAVGQISSTTETSPDRITLTSQINNNEFIIRKSSPVFANEGLTTRVLTSGKNDVYEFSVTPSENGSISLARLVFDVTQNDVGTVEQVELFRAGNKLTPGDASSTGQVYLRWDAGGASCFAHTTQAGGDGMDCAGGTSGNSKLIVTFTNDELISGKTNYKLRLNTQNVGDDASLQVSLSTEDENAKPSIGGSVPTTGSIYNNTGTNELFGTNTDFVNEATSITNRNIIWSDRTSLGSHQTPTLSPASQPITSTNSSTDYTNGYLLNINELLPVDSQR